MPLLVFNPEQLLVLSTCALTSPNGVSPLRALPFQADSLTSAVTWKETLEEFAREKMVVGDRTGKPRLCKELECLFFVLHRPEETFSISRFGAPDIAESFFCRSGITWFQLSVNFNEQLDVIQYPYDWGGLASWFGDELLGDVTPAQDDPPASDFTLTVPELIVLSALQVVYGKRVASSGPLSGDGLNVSLGELGSPAVVEAVHKVALVFVGKEKLAQSLRNPDLLSTAVGLLAEKGLAAGGGGFAAFSALGTKIFDPGRVLGAVVLKHFGDQLDAKLLHLLAGGYLLVEGAGEGTDLRMRSLPGSLPKADLFERLTEGLVAPTPALPEPEPAARPLQPETLQETATPTVLYDKPLGSVTLLVKEGAQTGREYSLSPGNVLGRDPSVDLPVEDPRVSRRHARFECGSDGTWTVRDLGSSNGTFVNGRAAAGVTAVSPGDMIRVGDTVMVFRLSG